MTRVGPLLATRQAQVAAVGLGVVVLMALLVAVGARNTTYLVVPLVLAILAVAAQLLRRLDPALIVTAGLVLAVFSGRWSYLGLPFGIDRLIVLAGIAALVVKMRRDPPRHAPAPPALYWLLALAFGYAVLSALFAGTFFNSFSFFELIDAFGLVPFLLFAFAPFLFDTPERRQMLLVALVALGAYLGITALGEGLKVSAIVFPKFITGASLSNYAGRAVGPFLEPGANGGGLIVCGTACAIALTQWRGRNARRAAFVILALCIAGIVFTLTRQVWLGGLVAAAVTFVATPELRRYTVPASAALLVTIVALVVFVPGLRDSAGTRFGEQSPLWDRENSNTAGLQMVATRPLFGFGWGSFPTRSEPYFKLLDHPVTTVGHIHSVFLSNLATLGIVGTGLWFAALVWAFVGGVRRRGPPEFEAWRTGFITVAVSWLVIANFTPLTYGFSNYMVWVWAGLLYVQPLRRTGSPQPETA